jgi:hypothetical protein
MACRALVAQQEAEALLVCPEAQLPHVMRVKIRCPDCNKVVGAVEEVLGSADGRPLGAVLSAQVRDPGLEQQARLAHRRTRITGSRTVALLERPSAKWLPPIFDCWCTQHGTGQVDDQAIGAALSEARRTDSEQRIRMNVVHRGYAVP